VRSKISMLNEQNEQSSISALSKIAANFPLDLNTAASAARVGKVWGLSADFKIFPRCSFFCSRVAAMGRERSWRPYVALALLCLLCFALAPAKAESDCKKALDKMERDISQAFANCTLNNMQQCLQTLPPEVSETVAMFLMSGNCTSESLRLRRLYHFRLFPASAAIFPISFDAFRHELITFKNSMSWQGKFCTAGHFGFCQRQDPSNFPPHRPKASPTSYLHLRNPIFHPRNFSSVTARFRSPHSPNQIHFQR
jgi:hypothetical protein